MLSTTLLFAACSGSQDSSVDSGSGGITVGDAWTRPTPAGVTEAAFYFRLENGGATDEYLRGALSDRCFMLRTHVTEIDDNGVSRMTSAGQDDLALPVGGSLELAPNGLHLMCMGLDPPIEANDDVMVELFFDDHPPLQVVVTADPTHE